MKRVLLKLKKSMKNSAAMQFDFANNPRSLRIAFIAGRLSMRASGVKVAVEQLSAALEGLGHEVRVFGIADKAWAMGDKALWAGAPSCALRTYGLPAFGYTPDLEKAVLDFSPDVIHSHGLWMYGSLIAERLSRSGIPDVISPHGMLDPWALSQSAWKKRFMRSLFEDRHVANANVVHALNNEEASAIHNFGTRAQIEIVPNGVQIIEKASGTRHPAWRNNLPKGAKVLLYFGRIHPKKNLISLLEAWSDVQRSPWHLVVAGPDQDGHRRVIENLIASRGLNKTVHLVGEQYGLDKNLTYETAEAFVLPSFSEGLPIAILEAWSWRLPVLMSRHCNLDAGFKSGAAIDTGTEVKTIAHALLQLFQMSDSQRAKSADSGRKLVEKKYSWHMIAKEFSRIYYQCLDGSSDCQPRQSLLAGRSI